MTHKVSMPLGHGHNGSFSSFGENLERLRYTEKIYWIPQSFFFFIMHTIGAPGLFVYVPGSDVACDLTTSVIPNNVKKKTTVHI